MLYYPRKSLDISIFKQGKVLLIQGVGVQSKVSSGHVFVSALSKGHKKWIGDSWKDWRLLEEHMATAKGKLFVI